MYQRVQYLHKKYHYLCSFLHECAKKLLLEHQEYRYNSPRKLP